jgi:tRNA(Ile)-lysidine synthase
MKKIDEKIIRLIEEYKLINKGDKILVALSGGPDSVFLFKFLLKYKKKYQIELGAMHLNHMIRGREANRDERFCKSLCLQLGINYYSVKRNVPAYAKKNKISIEEAAREIRYKELSKIQRKFGYDKVATGHTLSDNAETVLLNLIKGAGIKGLAGIPINRQNIIRPILSISKDEILDYLHKNNIEYSVDRTNLSSAYERNLIRNEIFPLVKKRLNPKIEQTLFKSSLILKKHSALLQYATEIISKEVVQYKKGNLEIDLGKTKSTSESIWSDVIKLSIDGNFKTQLSYKDCEKVISLFSKQIGKRISISNGLIALRERDKVLVFTKSKQGNINQVKIKIGDCKKINAKMIEINSVPKSRVDYSDNKNIEYINGDKAGKIFVIRYWKNGDRFYPLGLVGSKKISDFLNDQKVAAFDKKRQLVLTNGKKIVWLIGHRIDNRFKITEETKKVLQLCLK